MSPQRSWSDKRERQYDHIKDSLEDRGHSTDEAEEIAARTVNKARARSGEARSASRLSKTDISSQQRAAYRRTHGGSGRDATRQCCHHRGSRAGLRRTVPARRGRRGQSGRAQEG